MDSFRLQLTLVLALASVFSSGEKFVVNQNDPSYINIQTGSIISQRALDNALDLEIIGSSKLTIPYINYNNFN